MKIKITLFDDAGRVLHEIDSPVHNGKISYLFTEGEEPEDVNMRLLDMTIDFKAMEFNFDEEDPTWHDDLDDAEEEDDAIWDGLDPFDVNRAREDDIV